jgi:hypothetical protein
MQRPIELFALLDYIKNVIKFRVYSYFNSEPFETIFISYSDEPIISSVNRDLSNNNFIEVLHQIHSYEQANISIYQVYLSIKTDYYALRPELLEEDAINLIQEKYGIHQVDELISLLDLLAELIEEHKLK